MVATRHEVLSAFTHPSVAGWVYLETTFNEELRKLLILIPGVIHDPSLISQYISFDDGLRLLKMCPLTDPPQAETWVQPLRGTYKGDVGYVLSTTSSEVLLLLIPRLAPPNPSSLKRKRREIFPTTLFNHESAKQDYNIEPIRIDDNIYSFRNERFEHGLILKSFNTDSVSMALSTMPLESFSLFRESCHPKLTAFPRPSEWCFTEGDAVYVVDDSYPPAYKHGVISTIQNDSAELDTDEGIVCVRWLDICKDIRVGDFVEVTGGMHQGQRCWVDEVQLADQVANVIQLVEKEKLSESDRTEVCPIPNDDHLMPIFPLRRSRLNSMYCSIPLFPWYLEFIRSILVRFHNLSGFHGSILKSSFPVEKARAMQALSKMFSATSQPPAGFDF
jgi:hypothetical protein